MKRYPLLAGSVLLALFLIVGCSGDDGAQGPQGIAGPPGKPQPIKVLFAGGEVESALQNMAVAAFREDLFPLGTEIHFVNIAGDSVPPLSVLREYEAVLFWTDGSPTYPDSIGDRLAEYIEAGGGLVLAQGAFADFIPLGGRIFDPGYSPFKKVSGAGIWTERQIDFASLSFPLHVIFNGTDVQNLTYPGDGAFGDPTLDAGATLIALENNGLNCIAVSANERVIGLNIWPWSTFNNNATEAMQLIANCCMFVAGAI